MFVQAFANWATKAEIGTLKSILDTPENPKGITGQEKPWAAAVVALVRLDPKSAADAINQRRKYLFFRTDLLGALKPLTEVNGPISPVAQHFVDQLEDYHDDTPITAH